MPAQRRTTRRPTADGHGEAFTLDALAADPGLAVDLPADILAGLLVGVAAVQGALAARVLVLAEESRPKDSSPAEERLLTVEQAATRLAVSRDWLYRRASRLPFAVRLDSSGMTPRGRPRVDGERLIRITVDTPESLWQQAKIRAVEERSDLRAVVLAALRAYMKTKPRRQES